MYHGNISGLLSPIWTPIHRHKVRQKHKWFRSIFSGCTIPLYWTFVEYLDYSWIIWDFLDVWALIVLAFRSIFLAGMICLLGLMTPPLLVWSLPPPWCPPVSGVCRIVRVTLPWTSLDQPCDWDSVPRKVPPELTPLHIKFKLNLQLE